MAGRDNFIRNVDREKLFMRSRGQQAIATQSLNRCQMRIRSTAFHKPSHSAEKYSAMPQVNYITVAT